eukprot:gene17183-34396_t
MHNGMTWDLKLLHKMMPKPTVYGHMMFHLAADHGMGWLKFGFDAMDTAATPGSELPDAHTSTRLHRAHLSPHLVAVRAHGRCTCTLSDLLLALHPARAVSACKQWFEGKVVRIRPQGDGFIDGWLLSQRCGQRTHAYATVSQLQRAGLGERDPVWFIP